MSRITPAAIERGRYDGVFWAKTFMGVDLHPGQGRLFQAAIMRQAGARNWVAAYLTIALSAGNRAGKTLVMALVILHQCLYKMGMKPPAMGNDVEGLRWREAAYHWYHFAIQQEVADLVFTEITTMLQGVHVAQKDGNCPLSDYITANGGASVATWDKKEFGEYQLIQLDPSLGGATVHFRTTMGGRGRGALGRDMNGISFDECGLEPNLLWIVNNVLHLRRLGTGGQMFLFSTPEEGLTEFADLWFLGDPEQPDRRPRSMSLRMSTRDNIGFGIDQDMFDALTADMDDDHIAQNIDGHFIQGRTAYFSYRSVDDAFVADMPELQAAAHKHSYVQGVDPALTVDSMWSIVCDITAEVLIGVSVERLRGKKTTPAIVELAAKTHFAYEVNRPGLQSNCFTAIDSTGFGGHMFRDELNAAIPGGVRSVEFGGVTQKKRKLLGDLRTLLDQGKLKMPRTGRWLDVRRQLLGYKLEDKKIENDAVMALAVLVAEARHRPAGGLANVTLDMTELPYDDDAPSREWDQRGY